MQSPRHLPPQFLLPWLTPPVLRRSRCFHSSGGTTSTELPTPPPQPAKEKPLLEELFPETALSPSTRPKKHSRDIPRLAIPKHLDEHDSNLRRRRQRFVRRITPATSIELYVKTGQRPHPPSRAQPSTALPSSDATAADEPGVLVLHSASPCLAESDFRRLIPTGKHIKGWKSAGDILKIIPTLDPHTHLHTDAYRLLFATAASALHYRNRVLHLHLLARTHTPQKASSPVPPPPGYLIDGEDVYAALQAYALVPPTQTLGLKSLHLPLSASVKAAVEQAASDDGKGGRVVVWLEAGYGEVQTAELRRMVVDNGGERGRNRAWGLRGGVEGGVQEIETGHGRERASERLELGLGAEGGANGRKGKRAPRRWMLVFEQLAEARRFARTWHKRLVAASGAEGEDGGRVMLNAEMVW